MKVITFLSALLIVSTLKSQAPKERFSNQEYNSVFYSQFGRKKKVPEEIKKQALIALSYYPELADTRIKFRFRKRRIPLTSRPRILNVFLPKGLRSYIITISTSSTDLLSPILFQKLPYNAQIGVLGHEISHITQYKMMTSFQLIGLGFKISNADFADSFEFETDKRTIEHGLGFQLLEWSEYVREVLNIKQWHGANSKLSTAFAVAEKQRYMDPKTIKSHMNKYSIYEE